MFWNNLLSVGEYFLQAGQYLLFVAGVISVLVGFAWSMLMLSTPVEDYHSIPWWMWAFVPLGTLVVLALTIAGGMTLYG